MKNNLIKINKNEIFSQDEGARLFLYKLLPEFRKKIPKDIREILEPKIQRLKEIAKQEIINSGKTGDLNNHWRLGYRV